MATWNGDPQYLVAFWDLAETSGAVAKASGPTILDGAYVGGVTLAAGGPTFNGTTGYVTVPNDPALDIWSGPTANLSLLAVVKRGAIGAVRTLISKGATGYELRLDATGKPQLAVAGGAVICTAAAAIDTTQHVILASLSGTSAWIWVDGTQVATTASAPVIQSTAWPLTLGCTTSAGGLRSAFFNGTLVDAAVFRQPFNGLGAVVVPLTTGGLSNFPQVPALLTAWRDPADTTTQVQVQVPVVVWPGRGTVGTVTAQGLPLTITNGRGLAQFGVAPSVNGIPAGTPFTVAQTGDLGTTTWADYVHPNWAIARWARNIPLGDGATSLAVATKMVGGAHDPDGGAVFLRAATGSDLAAYAPGSVWTTSAATVQAQLPAAGAYLAVQVQMVRAT